MLAAVTASILLSAYAAWTAHGQAEELAALTQRLQREAQEAPPPLAPSDAEVRLDPSSGAEKVDHGNGAGAPTADSPPPASGNPKAAFMARWSERGGTISRKCWSGVEGSPRLMALLFDVDPRGQPSNLRIDPAAASMFNETTRPAAESVLACINPEIEGWTLDHTASSEGIRIQLARAN